MNYRYPLINSGKVICTLFNDTFEKKIIFNILQVVEVKTANFQMLMISGRY